MNLNGDFRNDAGTETDHSGVYAVQEADVGAGLGVKAAYAEIERGSNLLFAEMFSEL